MVRYCALLLAWLAIAGSTTAHAESGGLAGKIQVTLFLDRTEFLPGENVTCEICYYNVSEETITIPRPGGSNYGYYAGQYFRLFDAAREELTPGEPPTILERLPEDREAVVLEPGEEYWVVATPSMSGHRAYLVPGHFGLQVRYYYYEEVMPDFGHPPDLHDLIQQWRETHVKILDSNVVWFDIVERGRAKQPRLSLNGVEVVEARPLAFDGVLYAESGSLSPVGIKVDIDGEKVVASRGKREVTLALGNGSAKCDKHRPALWRGGSIYLPLRQVATALGLRVNWDPVRKIADVRS